MIQMGKVSRTYVYLIFRLCSKTAKSYQQYFIPFGRNENVIFHKEQVSIILETYPIIMVGTMCAADDLYFILLTCTLKLTHISTFSQNSR